MSNLHPFWWGVLGAAFVWLIGVIAVAVCFGVSRFAPGPASDQPIPRPTTSPRS